LCSKSRALARERGRERERERERGERGREREGEERERERGERERHRESRSQRWLGKKKKRQNRTRREHEGAKRGLRVFGRFRFQVVGCRLSVWGDGPVEDISKLGSCLGLIEFASLNSRLESNEEKKKRDGGSGVHDVGFVGIWALRALKEAKL
jgi:hypothetical protein